MRTFLYLSAVMALCLTQHSQTNASSITGSDITNGASSHTTTDGLVTLTPTSGGSASTIGSNGCCFGVGNDSVNDSDGDPTTTGDQESMVISLDASAVLNSLSFIFTRATTELSSGNPVGPLDDGIRISGFASDPGVFYFSEDNPAGTLNNISEVEGVSFSGDTLNIDHAWRGGAITVFEFANPASTLGQTLTLTVADRDESNPQANFRTISYSQVPEPTSLALTSFAFIATLLSPRSRKAN